MIIDAMDSMLNIDSLLFIQESAVAKSRKRPVGSTIESFNMEELMENIDSLISQFDQQITSQVLS